MRAPSITCAWLLLAGCPHAKETGPLPAAPDTDTDTDTDSDTDSDTDTDADTDTDTDTDTDVAHGTLRITYGFDGYVHEPKTCADAWVDTVWVNLALAGEATVQLSVPCDDQPIVLVPIATGSWTVSAQSVEDIAATGVPYSSSSEAVVVVDEGETAEVHLTLACHENGVDDGCGGA